MVEKVARALYYKLELEGKALAPGDHWEPLQRSSKRRWLEAARLAIEAMREPTERQIATGFDKLDYDDSMGDNADAFNMSVCGRVFTAMIDAALSD